MLCIIEWWWRLCWEIQKLPHCTVKRQTFTVRLQLRFFSHLHIRSSSLGEHREPPLRVGNHFETNMDTDTPGHITWTCRICIIQPSDRKLEWQPLWSIVPTVVGNPFICKWAQWTIPAPSALLGYSCQCSCCTCTSSLLTKGHLLSNVQYLHQSNHF